MESSKRTAIIIILGVFSAFVLLMSSKDIEWFTDEIFAIMLSILFFSPVVSALLNGKPPKEWIVVLVIGGGLFIVYIFYNFERPIEVIEFIFILILVTSISLIGEKVSKTMERVIPPS